MTIKITSEKTAFDSMEPIWIGVNVSNLGKDTIIDFNGWRYGEYPYTFTIKNQNGNTFPFTQKGKIYEELIASGHPLNPISRPIGVQIAQGKNLSERIAINKYVDISAFESMSETDAITIQVQRYGCLSNELKVKINHQNLGQLPYGQFPKKAVAIKAPARAKPLKTR